ncbi:hypothetical protein Peur_059354 [Populus x canadensis]
MKRSGERKTKWVQETNLPGKDVRRAKTRAQWRRWLTRSLSHDISNALSRSCNSFFKDWRYGDGMDLSRRRAALMMMKLTVCAYRSMANQFGLHLLVKEYLSKPNTEMVAAADDRLHLARKSTFRFGSPGTERAMGS